MRYENVPGLAAAPQTAHRSDFLPDAWSVAVGVGVIALAFAMRIPGLIDPRFWQDEMISLAIAGDGFLETIIGTLRFSAHPPAYYAQLNLWLLGGKDASYILLNSVLWSVGGVAAIFYLGRQIAGEKMAALAALFLALMPMGLYFSENARMYAMISTLEILAWWAAERFISLCAEDRRVYWRALAGLCLAQIIIGFAHGIGPVFSACIGLFGLIRLLEDRAPRPAIKTFIAVQIAVGAILMAVLLNGMMRETQHQPPESLNEIIIMLTGVLFGPAAHAPVWAPAALAVYGGVLLAAFFDRRLRALALALVVLPIAASIVTTLLLKPVLSLRPLALTLPFIALCLAGGLLRAHDALTGPVARAGLCGLGALIAAGFFTASLVHIKNHEKPHDFRAAALDISREAAPGDLILLMENPTIFWGLSWYLAGPESVAALKIQSPPNERWRALYAKLGDSAVAFLGLEAKTDTLMWNGVPVILGEQGLDSALKHGRVWLAYYKESDVAAVSATLLENGRKQTPPRNYRGLIVSRFDAPNQD